MNAIPSWLHTAIDTFQNFIRDYGLISAVFLIGVLLGMIVMIALRMAEEKQDETESKDR